MRRWSVATLICGRHKTSSALIQSTGAFPLMDGDEPLGAVALSCASERVLGDDEPRLLATVSVTAGATLGRLWRKATDATSALAPELATLRAQLRCVRDALRTNDERLQRHPDTTHGGPSRGWRRMPASARVPRLSSPPPSRRAMHFGRRER